MELSENSKVVAREKFIQLLSYLSLLFTFRWLTSEKRASKPQREDKEEEC